VRPCPFVLASASLSSLLVACPSVHTGDGGPTIPNCSAERTVTLAVIANVDGVNEQSGQRAEVTVRLAERLLRGDPDGDGLADVEPIQRVRVMMTTNETMERESAMGACGTLGRGGAWTSEFLERNCPESRWRRDQVVHEFDTSMAWEEDLRCLLDTDGFRADGACQGETFEAALAALSPDPGPLDLSPLVGLGDSLNAGYQSSDVLVLILQSPDWRDDCSRPIEASPAVSDVCDGLCCERNLPGVERTSDALRSIVGDRPVVFASYGQHPAFDPSTEGLARLDRLLEVGPEWTGCFQMRPHLRTTRLARALYPDMHLVPLTCSGETAIPDLEPLARRVFSKFCE